LTVFLDSSACIALIRQRPAIVRERTRQAEAAGHRIFLSSIVAFELWYGVAYSSQPELNARLLEGFLITMRTVPFDDEDAKVAGAIRADLRQRGSEIGPYDCLIAAQALRRDFVLITGNVREFSRVKGLRWENWAE
jgi:tRNA(fMet)-specific endonuclease VapC